MLVKKQKISPKFLQIIIRNLNNSQNMKSNQTNPILQQQWRLSRTILLKQAQKLLWIMLIVWPCKRVIWDRSFKTWESSCNRRPKRSRGRISHLEKVLTIFTKWETNLIRLIYRSCNKSWRSLILRLKLDSQALKELSPHLWQLLTTIRLHKTLPRPKVHLCRPLKGAKSKTWNRRYKIWKSKRRMMKGI